VSGSNQLSQRGPKKPDVRFSAFPHWSIKTGELLDEILRGLRQVVKGIPAGFLNILPTRIQAGVVAFAGDVLTGWAAASHRHDVETEAAVSLGEANAEGSGTALSRADHVHRLDVRVAKDGATVGTRKRINLVGYFVVADDPGNDEVDVEIDADALAAAFGGGGWFNHYFFDGGP